MFRPTRMDNGLQEKSVQPPRKPEAHRQAEAFDGHAVEHVAGNVPRLPQDVVPAQQDADREDGKEEIGVESEQNRAFAAASRRPRCAWHGVRGRSGPTHRSPAAVRRKTGWPAAAATATNNRLPRPAIVPDRIVHPCVFVRPFQCYNGCCVSLRTYPRTGFGPGRSPVILGFLNRF